ncbi:MAG: hypothetical protein IJQ39_11780 [Thermoguttaceae bacterium]|nr:hypothetical protein [Thermoguttaceae bacterium]
MFFRHTSNAAGDCREPGVRANIPAKEIVSNTSKGARDRLHPKEVFRFVFLECTLRTKRNYAHFIRSVTVFH